MIHHVGEIGNAVSLGWQFPEGFESKQIDPDAFRMTQTFLSNLEQRLALRLLCG